MTKHTPTVFRTRFEQGPVLEVTEVLTDLDNEKHRAIKHVNSCPLDRAHYKLGLIDKAGHQAGEAFHHNWRRVSVGSDSVPDLDRVPGENTHGSDEGEMRAREWLRRMNRCIGRRDWELLVLICGEERSFEDARLELNRKPMGKKLPRHYIGPRFAEAIEALAVAMGLTQPDSYVTERN